MTAQRCSQNMSGSDVLSDNSNFLSSLIFWTFLGPIFSLIANLIRSLFGFVFGCIGDLLKFVFGYINYVFSLIPDKVCDFIIKIIVSVTITCFFFMILKSCNGNAGCEILMIREFSKSVSQSFNDCDDLYGCE